MWPHCWIGQSDIHTHKKKAKVPNANEIVKSPVLEILKSCLDVVLCSWLYLRWLLLEEGDWARWPPEGYSRRVPSEIQDFVLTFCRISHSGWDLKAIWFNIPFLLLDMPCFLHREWQVNNSFYIFSTVLMFLLYFIKVCCPQFSFVAWSALIY